MTDDNASALARRFALVLVLVLVRCCLQKRRVNPIRSAFSELHPRSGLKGVHKALRSPKGHGLIVSPPAWRGAALQDGSTID
jgi:hypothetical protein